MHHLIVVRSPEELARHSGATYLPPFDPGDLVRHASDAHWLLVNGDGQMVGRCSLWWRRTPPHPGHRLGLIGHYAVRDAEAARLLLQHACEQLAEKSCTLAVGPMDGNTWRRYRLIVERGSEPTFFLEPDNPDDWPGHFAAAGFVAMAYYTSALSSDLTRSDPRVVRVAERLRARGVRVRSLDPGRFEQDLRVIYGIAEASFRRGVLYAPISAEEFLAQYRVLRPYMRPELVLIAECEEQPLGFVFGVPDHLEAVRCAGGDHPGRGRIATVIFKTIAVHPDCRGVGLGAYLAACCHAVARDLGYSRAIHALMHETNDSQRISAYYARPMRRYALFSAQLRP